MMNIRLIVDLLGGGRDEIKRTHTECELLIIFRS